MNRLLLQILAVAFSLSATLSMAQGAAETTQDFVTTEAVIANENDETLINEDSTDNDD